MRVIQIGQFPSNVDCIKGGVEASVYGLTKELSKSAEVIVIDIPRIGFEDQIERFGTITVHRFRNPGKFQINATRRVRDIVGIVRSYNSFICHIHGTNPFSWQMLKTLKRCGIPVALTVHGVMNVEKKNALKRRFSLKALYQYVYQGYVERRILSKTESVIVDTEYVKEAVRSLRLKSTPLMRVIPQGIDKSYFGLTCSSTSRTILSVGAFARRKGHLFLIQAFELVCAQECNTDLIICGSVAETQYLNEIETYLSKSPYKERIQLVINASKDALQNYYQKAHIFALHSQEESQGIVLAEAMAVGLPVVSTRVGGIPFVIDDGKTGLITDYGDLQSFANSILYLLNNDVDWLKMSGQCRMASEKYSWSSIVEQITNMYSFIH